MKRSPLGRKTPLQRSQSLTRRVMKAKRARVTPEERAGRRGLKARSGGVCEVDGRNPATDAHHRVNRSQGGTWSLSNLMHLCHDCHMAVTVNPRIAREWGRSLLSTQVPASSPVFLAGFGWSLLSADGAIAPTERKAA